ncbi:MAG: hypothetical protein ACKO11_11305 [Cuspidothrix sp.]
MNNHINEINTHNMIPSCLELELLEVLLKSPDPTYPWNLADTASEAYFDHLEEQCGWQDFPQGELNTGADNFYQNLDIIWDQLGQVQQDNFYKNTANSLQKALENTFSTIPGFLITAIAQKAAEVFIIEQSASEKLVQCVQALLPGWQTDDLLVLARPFAYSMRSSQPQTLTSLSKDVYQQDWANLSGIEQAKISLAIANYALEYLDQFPGKIKFNT